MSIYLLFCICARNTFRKADLSCSMAASVKEKALKSLPCPSNEY